MDMNNSEAMDFLVELYNRTEGSEENQVSMHDVGAALGMDKSQAGALGEELIVEGLADLRTLAGGIAITSQGLEMLQKAGLITAVIAKSDFQLSGGPVLQEADHEEIEKILEKIRQAVSQQTAAFEVLEEIVIDLKTIEVQLLSPKPKTAVVCQVFSSLQSSLKELGLDELSTIFAGVID